MIFIFVGGGLFISNNALLSENTQTLKNLGSKNLPLIADLSELGIRMNDNHSRLALLLISAFDDPDEERVYIDGRDLLFDLHDIEKQLATFSQITTERNEELLNGIAQSFKKYQYASNSGIEIVTVDAKLAMNELSNATKALTDLNHLFLKLSEYHSGKLNASASLISNSLESNTSRFFIAIIIILLMIALAIYISNDMSSKLNQINQALIDLSKKKKIQHLPEQTDGYLEQLTDAVHAFEATMTISNQRQKKLQGALRELDQQKFALDQHAIVAITDVKGDIIYSNESFCTISGYSEAELQGQNHRMLNSGFHDKSVFTEMYKTISKGNVWHGQLCNRNKSGQLYWVDTTIAPFLDDSGKPIRYIAIRTDITSNKENEIALLKSKEAADEALKVKSEFLATMSHEIRTPMNGVLGMLNLLLKMSLNDEQLHRAKLAKTSAKALLNLIDDILDFSRIDAGKLSLESIDFDIRDLLSEFSESMALKSQQKGVELIIDTLAIAEPMVKGDSNRITQILTNLVGNAIKFTDEGEIVITASLKDDPNGGQILHCSIRDTGIGIAQDRLDQLFNMFTQADSSTTRKYGGTGLGLAIAKQLCVLMGGAISATSTVGQGSIFEFYILLGKSAVLTSPLLTDGFNSRHALIVAHNQANCEAIKAMLSSWGVTVSVVTEPEGSIQAECENNRSEDFSGFDIAFIDVNVIDNYGAQLTQELRDSNRNKSLILVAMTPMDHTGSLDYFSRRGFDGFFAKPAIYSDLYKSMSLIQERESSGLVAAPVKISPMESEASGSDINNTDISGSDVSEDALPDSVGGGLDGIRALLVEDNLINQQVALFILMDLGVDAEIANNGQECLEMLQQCSPDAPYQVVLMDCQMPVMNGYQATEAIREGQAGDLYKSIPVIAMTANAISGDREKCLNSGMNDYLSKPIEEESLAETIETYIHT
jgi:polar amino acid transport system substrate-binding protein